MSFAILPQYGDGIRRQSFAVMFCEVSERFVDGGAAIGCGQRHVNGIERKQSENMLCVNGVGIAQPMLDLGDGHFERPQRQRRFWRRLRHWRHLFWVVQFAGKADVICAPVFRCPPKLFTRNSFQPMQKT